MANGVLAPLFKEIDPSLILRCSHEVNTSLDMVNSLYAHTLSLGFYTISRIGKGRSPSSRTAFGC